MQNSQNLDFFKGIFYAKTPVIRLWVQDRVELHGDYCMENKHKKERLDVKR
jgi:hypothetical protein